ncbi:unnamed protein product [Rhizophagus irregularis]|nr:unnamed protein product [Rhizophagus irregularis]
MALYQLFFIKNLRFIFIGAFIILNIYSFYHDVNSFNKAETFPFPDTTGIAKIDVGQGDDMWILTEDYELYHWDAIERKFINKASPVNSFSNFEPMSPFGINLYKNYLLGSSNEPIHDFSVGPDGSVITSDSVEDLYIRSNIDSWEEIDGSYFHSNISICDYNKVFTTDNSNLFVGSYYNNVYSLEILDRGTYYQISCAFHDKSLWFIGSGHYIYLYINNYKKIIRSEVQFKQIKALSEQHAIGIDYNYTLWEYINGTWTWIRNNVRTASINHNAETFPFPDTTGIAKIDVGQRDDLWILTEDYELYHWDEIKRKFIHRTESYGTSFYDFSVGPDGSVVFSYYDIFTEWIDHGTYIHKNISICDYNKVFTTDNSNLFVGSYYNNVYSREILDRGPYYQVSCAFHDKSLWFIGYNHYIYLYINNYKKIIRSEVQFKQIKALSEQHAIGIDYDYTLWEYINGTWTWIRNNVRTASINYNGEIFYIHNNNNFIYKISKN